MTSEQQKIEDMELTLEGKFNKFKGMFAKDCGDEKIIKMLMFSFFSGAAYTFDLLDTINDVVDSQRRYDQEVFILRYEIRRFMEKEGIINEG